MRILLVDDEQQALNDLIDVLRRVVPDAEITATQSAKECLSIVEGLQPDLIFSDIEMPNYSGLKLAKNLKEKLPDTPLIFVSGYDSFAMMAWGLHVSGYLLKPVEEKEIRDTLNHLHFEIQHDPNKLQVRCFGDFSLTYQGQPVHFKRTRTMEVFAYLVNARGGLVSGGELMDAIWEGAPLMEKNRIYLRQLFHDMRQTLKAIGCEDVLLHSYDNYSLDVSKISCDYYKFLQRDLTAINSFRGEYMNQYSWADMTLAQLTMHGDGQNVEIIR